MPKKCQICKNERREDIEKALLGRESFSEVADRYGVSKRSLRHHKENHLPKLLAKAQDLYETGSAGSLLEKLDFLRRKALFILEAAELSGDLRTALAGIREARGCLDLLAKITGEIQPSSVSVVQNVGIISTEGTRVKLLRMLDSITGRLVISGALSAPGEQEGKRPGSGAIENGDIGSREEDRCSEEQDTISSEVEDEQ